jgi:hypothetical protein
MTRRHVYLRRRDESDRLDLSPAQYLLGSVVIALGMFAGCWVLPILMGMP